MEVKQETAHAPARPILWIVIPCYNEEEVLPVTAPCFLAQLLSMEEQGLISERSRILFVSDGSKDGTWEAIRSLSGSDPRYQGICLSRNRGHQNALAAGLMEARPHCDITVTADCDGQDDVSAMTEMVKEYLKGSEIVYGVRSGRSSDSWFKRVSAEGFYRLMKALGADVVFEHADFRLVSSRVLDHFADYGEVNLFLRGMFPLLGFPSSAVSYERRKREAGKSHYTFRRMLGLAADGITSLTVRPISMIAGLGIVFSLLGLVLTVWAIADVFLGNTVPGWASIVCIVSFMSGIQLISLGVIGQYVGKTYLEAKHRPRYIVSDRTDRPYRRIFLEERECEDRDETAGEETEGGQ